MTRISSKAYRDGSRGQPCSLQISGVCNNDPETTVYCHLRDEHAGAGIKASDISGCDGCSNCHSVIDFRTTFRDGKVLTKEEWLFYALRGLQRTLENRIQRGILIMPADATETRRTSTAKPKKIASPGFSQAHRPLRSRPFRKGME